MDTLTINNNSTSETIKEIVAYKLGLAQTDINDAASFADDLAVDSLDVLEIIMEVEKCFGITIPGEDAEKIKTVGTLIKYVTKQRR